LSTHNPHLLSFAAISNVSRIRSFGVYFRYHPPSPAPPLLYHSTPPNSLYMLFEVSTKSGNFRGNESFRGRARERDWNIPYLGMASYYSRHDFVRSSTHPIPTTRMATIHKIIRPRIGIVNGFARSQIRSTPPPHRLMAIAPARPNPLMSCAPQYSSINSAKPIPKITPPKMVV
jgi:hypothetical protein